MEQADGRWRNRYYAAALDRICLISLRIDQSRDEGWTCSDDWPNVNLHSLQGSNQATGQWQTPLTPTTRASLTAWSPTSTVSTTSLGSSNKSNWDSNAISPGTQYNEMASCFSAPQSPSPNLNEARCDLCNATFKGASRFSNLQRHLRSTKVHGGLAKLSCEQPGCEKKFTRSDNLSHHVQVAHQALPS